MTSTVYAKPIGYRFVEFLGEGLNSCVYKAFREDDELGVSHCFAVKILKSEKKVALWRTEVDRLTKIRSPYCVSLLGWEILFDKPALILEYIEGVTLADLLEAGVLDSMLLGEIVAQSRMGLQDLTLAETFHGDLNLTNIMVTAEGRVKLVDFGVFDEESVYATPRFAAPEILMGGRPSAATDLFSLRAVAESVAHEAGFSLRYENLDGVSSAEGPREKLGLRVKEVLRKLYDRLRKTRELRSPGEKPRPWQKIKWLSFLIVGMMWPFWSQGDQPRFKSEEVVRISVRSRSWAQIEVDGRPMGYTPLDFFVKSRRQFRLSWRYSDGSGQTSLTLSGVPHIVLDDGFFKRRTRVKGASDVRFTSRSAERIGK